MAAKSKLEKYRYEIQDLIDKGVSIRSTWKIINSYLSEDAKMSYSSFYHFAKQHIEQSKD
ncbi:hypothetical protein [Sulfurimonas sp.]|uniref:hypothetical protein n=1 Tax=Sulfurimonas sp. TaxID=2022749 RepID=UPI0025E55E2D|nr:hypothetical protein [Sulfurimonas sp.]MBW6487473.1 hypothetical protein [Sulfurimonas sp.]